MGVQISGNNLSVPGQATISGIPASLDHALTRRYGGTLRAFIGGLNLNAAAPVDLTTLLVPSDKYVPVRCVVFDPSGNMASATLGLYTQAAGAGTAIVAPTLLASLTAVGKFQALTIAALTDVITATSLYPRLTVAAGAPGTGAMLLEFIDLALI